MKYICQKYQFKTSKNVLALKIHGLKHVAAVYYSNPLPPKKPAALKRKKMLKPKKRKKMYYKFRMRKPEISLKLCRSFQNIKEKKKY